MDFRALQARAREQKRAAAEAERCQRVLAELRPAFRVGELAPGFQLERFRCGGGGVGMDAVFYVPEFVPKDQEQVLAQLVLAASHGKWVDGRNRRMSNFGGRPGDRAVAEPLPDFLQAVVDKVVSCGAFPASRPPNHVLVNHYARGGGILPHTDGPLYHPTVAVLSLQGSAVLHFHTPAMEYVASMLLQPCSLHVVSGPMYSDHLHSIADAEQDVVEASCANLGLVEGVAVGSCVQRSADRLSIVLVHKLQE